MLLNSSAMKFPFRNKFMFLKSESKHWINILYLCILQRGRDGKSRGADE